MKHKENTMRKKEGRQTKIGWRQQNHKGALGKKTTKFSNKERS
jgi:hypothetical protein